MSVRLAHAAGEGSGIGGNELLHDLVAHVLAAESVRRRARLRRFARVVLALLSALALLAMPALYLHVLLG